jgi:hypothetical protein
VVRGHVAAKAAGFAFRVGCRLQLDDGSEWLVWPGSRAAYGRLTTLLSRGRIQAPKGECLISRAALLAATKGGCWRRSRRPGCGGTPRRCATGSPCRSFSPPPALSAAATATGSAAIRSDMALMAIIVDEEQTAPFTVPFQACLFRSKAKLPLCSHTSS